MVGVASAFLFISLHGDGLFFFYHFSSLLLVSHFWLLDIILVVCGRFPLELFGGSSWLSGWHVLLVAVFPVDCWGWHRWGRVGCWCWRLMWPTRAGCITIFSTVVISFWIDSDRTVCHLMMFVPFGLIASYLDIFHWMSIQWPGSNISILHGSVGATFLGWPGVVAGDVGVTWGVGGFTSWAWVVVLLSTFCCA